MVLSGFLLVTLYCYMLPFDRVVCGVAVTVGELESRLSSVRQTVFTTDPRRAHGGFLCTGIMDSDLCQQSPHKADTLVTGGRTGDSDMCICNVSA